MRRPADGGGKSAQAAVERPWSGRLTHAYVRPAGAGTMRHSARLRWAERVPGQKFWTGAPGAHASSVEPVYLLFVREADLHRPVCQNLLAKPRAL
jgi:hypothetical protein